MIFANRNREPELGKVFTAQQIASYREKGYAAPARVLSVREAAEFHAAFEAYEISKWGRSGQAYDDQDGREWLRKPHRYARWAYELATHPRVVDAIEDILGPNVMLWDSKLFPKPARSASYVSWHQDGTYLGLEPLTDVLTAWVALSDSLPENGAMRAIPGSHKRGQLEHKTTFADGNLLLNGQVIEGIENATAVDIPLRAGEMSVHHMMLVHGSLPNASDKPRIGISINYVTPMAHETLMKRPALLLRGEDRYGHFEPLHSPFMSARSDRGTHGE
jgi:ectoine hydroxylase-related dioxygenase (phytanoyl-CoA dioxygenase family)